MVHRFLNIVPNFLFLLKYSIIGTKVISYLVLFTF
jgi:hypothetical protein